MQTPEMVQYTKKTNADRIVLKILREDEDRQVALYLEQGMTGSTSVAGLPLIVQALRLRADKITTLLLSRGNYANLRSEQNATLLMEAIKAGSFSAVEALLKQGANVNAVDSKDRTALMYAAGAWMRDVPAGMTPLGQTMQAVQTQKPRTWNKEAMRRMISLLLERGARIDVKDKYGLTAMMYASGRWGGQHTLVEVLLNRGVDPDEAFFGVAGSGDAELIQKLIAKGADINRRHPGTYPTALVYAKTMLRMYPDEQHKRVVQILVKAGAKE